MPLLRYTRLDRLKPQLYLLKIFSQHLAAFLLEAMKNINHIFYPRKVNDPVPRSLILIAQFKYAWTNRSQRSVIGGSLAQLELPKLKSKILSYAIGEALKNFPRVTFPRDLCEPAFFGFRRSRERLYQQN